MRRTPVYRLDHPVHRLLLSLILAYHTHSTLLPPIPTLARLRRQRGHSLTCPLPPPGGKEQTAWAVEGTCLCDAVYDGWTPNAILHVQPLLPMLWESAGGFTD